MKKEAKINLCPLPTKGMSFVVKKAPSSIRTKTICLNTRLNPSPLDLHKAMNEEALSNNEYATTID